jgi:5'-methylthioadenosine phosphorylase
MGRLGLIVGSNALGASGEGVTDVAARHGAVVLQRHRAEPDGGYTLPHRIDHVASLRSLADAGCDRVLAIGSVGSLDPGLAVGSFLCPDDFIALQLGVSAFDDARGHAMPGFDRDWRATLVGAWADAGAPALRDGGVYWQTIGPRFETPAEIRLIAAHADVVGMTIASECVVARELGLPYAAICLVDNLANGVGALGLEELERNREANQARLLEALGAVLPALAGGDE